MINSAQLAQMDHILRRVKGNNVPYGGALLFSSGDNKQIRPIEGNSVWSSNLLITSHDVLYFHNPVRCCGDVNLERFITLSRKNLQYDSSDMHDLMLHLRAGIPNENFLPSWDHLEDPNVFKIVSTKAAMKEADAKFISYKRAQGVPYEVLTAVDEYKDKKSGDWTTVPESSNFSSVIDQRYDTVDRELYIFNDTKMAFTANNNTDTRSVPRFSQGQLMHIDSLPTSQDNRVHGRLLKAGSDHMADDLREIKLGVKTFPHFTHKEKNCTSLLRRKQIPLRYHNCSTIHKVIGKTVDKLATQITKREDNNKYFVWDKEMLVVLMSRVRTLQNLYFIGSKEDTLNVIRSILSKRDDYSEFLDNRMKELDILKDRECSRVVSPYPTEFFKANYSMPLEDDVGFVGLLISRKDPSLFRVVQCQSLQDELKSVNSANGLGFDAKFRPYTFGIFVFGFLGGNDAENHLERLEYFLAMKDQMFQAQFRLGPRFTWEMAVHAFYHVHQSFFRRDKKNYTIVKCLPLSTSYEFAFDRFLRDNADDDEYRRLTMERRF